MTKSDEHLVCLMNSIDGPRARITEPFTDLHLLQQAVPKTRWDEQVDYLTIQFSAPLDTLTNENVNDSRINLFMGWDDSRPPEARTGKTVEELLHSTPIYSYPLNQTTTKTKNPTDLPTLNRWEEEYGFWDAPTIHVEYIEQSNNSLILRSPNGVPQTPKTTPEKERWQDYENFANKVTQLNLESGIIELTNQSQVYPDYAVNVNSFYYYKDEVAHEIDKQVRSYLLEMSDQTIQWILHNAEKAYFELTNP